MPKTGENDLAIIIKDLNSNLSLVHNRFSIKVCVTFSTGGSWGTGKSKPSPLSIRQIEDLMKGTLR